MTDDIDRLERDAKRVRGQLAQDLDELLLRLSPRRIVRQAAEYARETRPDFGRAVVREIRHNPLPYLLIGMGVAGIAWAIASRTRPQSRLPVPAEALAVDTVPAASARTPAGPVAPARPIPAVAHPEREVSSATPAVE